ncbi:MAG: hypothetical protein E7152_06090 [Enterococcus casseliflavus]|nr:hypothetical protein [Enterococcus casseliflavus]
MIVDIVKSAIGFKIGGTFRMILILFLPDVAPWQPRFLQPLLTFIIVSDKRVKIPEASVAGFKKN